MEIALTVLIGYALGCLSPAALFSKLKKHDLRSEGTGNLGATNVTMVMGKGFGAFVMLFDIFKGAMAYILPRLIFPGSAYFKYIGLIGGLSAMLGHVFPFYLGFKGGKGLAAFGGVVLAYDPLMFLLLILSCFVLMIIVNYSFILPFTGAALFCVFASIKELDLIVFGLTALMSAMIIWKHSSNFTKAKHSKDIKVRDYIKKHIFGKKLEEETVADPAEAARDSAEEN